MPRKLKPSDLKVKTQKRGPQSEDIKDREIYAAPPTHHKIKCKSCAKEAKVEVKFTRLCNACRNTSSYRLSQPCIWTSWGSSEPTVGDMPLERVLNVG